MLTKRLAIIMTALRQELKTRSLTSKPLLSEEPPSLFSEYLLSLFFSRLTSELSLVLGLLAGTAALRAVSSITLLRSKSNLQAGNRAKIFRIFT